MLSVTENEILKNVTTLPLSQTSKLTDVLKLSFNRQSDGSVFPDCFKNVSFFAVKSGIVCKLLGDHFD